MSAQTSPAHLLRHPVRAAIAAHIANVEPDEHGRLRASSVEIAKATGIELGVIAYHVRFMRDRGVLVEAGTRPVRGAIQTFYSLADRELLLAGLRKARDELDTAIRKIELASMQCYKAVASGRESPSGKPHCDCADPRRACKREAAGL